MRVLVTRPRAQAQTWVDGLRAAGLQAVSLPLIEIAPPPDPGRVTQAWSELHRYAQVMFVSPSAVQAFFDQGRSGLAWPTTLRAATVGQGTWRALRAQGVDAACIDTPASDDPAAWESEGLWSQVLSQREWHGREVLLVRGQEGRDWLARQWEQAGAHVQILQAYARKLPPYAPDVAQRVRAACADPGGHVWLFSSSQAVAHLQLWQAQDPQLGPQAWQAAKAVATHPRIAEAARAAGFGHVLTASPCLDDVVRSIESAA